MTAPAHSTHVGTRAVRGAVPGAGGPLYFSRCGCGWEGPSRMGRSDAVNDGFDHLIGQGIGREQATSREQYEAACDRYNAAVADRAEAQQILARAESEESDAAAELALHEAYPGIPLYNRCPTCAPSAPLDVRAPAGHPGECEQ